MILIGLATLCLAGCCSVEQRETLYQTSTLHALLEGVYDGETTLGMLRSQGDMGIGTFNALDGELAMVDGVVYQIRADGKVYRPGDDERTPFACVTSFAADRTWRLRTGETFEMLRGSVGKLEAGNLPLAFVLEGTFSYVKTRAAPRQSKPYKKLAEALAHQPEFEFHSVHGVMVGFALPEYFAGINVAGYHLHFLTEDRRAGGHVLAFTAEDVRVAVDVTPNVHLALPSDDTFRRANLGGDRTKEIEAVER
jgi:acetolactate decarboxylase